MTVALLTCDRCGVFVEPAKRLYSDTGGIWCGPCRERYDTMVRLQHQAAQARSLAYTDCALTLIGTAAYPVIGVFALAGLMPAVVMSRRANTLFEQLPMREELLGRHLLPVRLSLIISVPASAAVTGLALVMVGVSFIFFFAGVGF